MSRRRRVRRRRRRGPVPLRLALLVIRPCRPATRPPGSCGGGGGCRRRFRRVPIDCRRFCVPDPSARRSVKSAAGPCTGPWTDRIPASSHLRVRDLRLVFFPVLLLPFPCIFSSLARISPSKLPGCPSRPRQQRPCARRFRARPHRRLERKPGRRTRPWHGQETRAGTVPHPRPRPCHAPAAPREAAGPPHLPPSAPACSPFPLF